MRWHLALGAALIALVFACGDDKTDQEPACGPEPIPECSSTCDKACAALTACGQATSTCLTDCRSAMRCPGESRGHDSAICKGLVERISGASCVSICDETTRLNVNPNSCRTPTSDGGTDAAGDAH